MPLAPTKRHGHRGQPCYNRIGVAAVLTPLVSRLTTVATGRQKIGLARELLEV